MMYAGSSSWLLILASEWETELPVDEAPSDYQGNSIDIVTVHRAKGLEWPIVIPINFVTMPENDEDFFFRSTDSSVHWTLGESSQAPLILRLRPIEPRRGRTGKAVIRGLHTCSDLLVLPEASWAPDGRWAKFFDLGQSVLEEIKYPPPQRAEPTHFSP